jgi:alanyl-tRNA synthetase
MYSSTEAGDAGGQALSSPAGTERLYYTDAYQRTFRARVTAVVSPGRLSPPAGTPTPPSINREEAGPLRTAREDHPGGLVLDRTAFYPTSGGQPHDTGTLAGRPVVDVVDTGEDIVHVLGAPPCETALAVGTEVDGAIDWDRRFDHMQQHTAQHILSAAFLHVLGAETASVHLGETSTLDLEIPALSGEDAARVEDAATRIIFENRSVTIRFVDNAQAQALGLRRPPRRTGQIRLVEVADYDRSACGGTHVRTTGEVGLLLLRRAERTRGRIRVEFLAGWRAVRDYRWKNAIVNDWSGRLTVRDRELGDALDRLAREAKDRERALADTRRRLLTYEVAELLAAAPAGSGARVLRLEFPTRAPDEVQFLLHEMTARERCVVLAGVLETGRLFFSRSSGDGPEMAGVLARACRAVGGRGGGTPEFAQGKVPPGAAVTQALALAEQEIRGA